MRDEEGKEIWEGYCIDFVKKLSEEMQFDYELVIPEDEEFGKKLPNGEWNGLIGDLAKGVRSIFAVIFMYIKNVRILPLPHASVSSSMSCSIMRLYANLLRIYYIEKDGYCFNIFIFSSSAFVEHSHYCFLLHHYILKEHSCWHIYSQLLMLPIIFTNCYSPQIIYIVCLRIFRRSLTI